MSKVLDRSVVQEPFVGRPHVLILGAGATLAAFPNGDRNGRKLPLIHNIVEVCGLQPILDAHGLTYQGGDFEAFFASLVAAGTHPDTIAAMERAIFDYFAAMELPDGPTLYDHLVLSLRPKDVIATFNWDPFLWQALQRNCRFTDMPTPLFLHGNVAVGHCMQHKPASMGPRGDRCRQCGKPLQDSRLLYPVEQKNYNSDSFIKKSWNLLDGSLKDAFLVTIFGYSAPVTDVAAVKLLKMAWGKTSDREMEQFEMIDLKSEDDLHATWRNFIHSHHYQCTNDFYKSYACKHPRRTCDALFRTLIDAEFINDNILPRTAPWDDLYSWLRPIIDDEESYAASH